MSPPPAPIMKMVAILNALMRYVMTAPKMKYTVLCFQGIALLFKNKRIVTE
jgi:hypothetical protein